MRGIVLCVYEALRAMCTKLLLVLKGDNLVGKNPWDTVYRNLQQKDIELEEALYAYATGEEGATIQAIEDKLKEMKPFLKELRELAIERRAGIVTESVETDI